MIVTVWFAAVPRVKSICQRFYELCLMEKKLESYYSVYYI